MRKHIGILGIFFLLTELVLADGGSKIASNINSVSERPENFIELISSNDVFFNTDYYYTNGVSLEFQIDRLALKISDKLPFFKGDNLERRYRYNLSQKIYTPENYATEWINYKDRPYAGVLTITYSEDIFSNTNKKQTFGIQLGVIGKSSGTEQTQNFIHSKIDNNQARGWYSQIGSDLVINFNYTHTRQLFYSKSMDLTGQAAINLGTLNTNLAADLQYRLGKRIYNFGNSGPIGNIGDKNIWQFYFFMGVTPRFVIYNATLQGGLFNPSQVYPTFSYNEIEKLIFELRAGVTLGYKNFNLTFQANEYTPEFIGGDSHAWGTIRLRYTF